MCVLCYSIAHKPCPHCMVRGGKWMDRWVVQKERILLGEDGRPLPPRSKRQAAATRLVPMECPYCSNQRWILDIEHLKRHLSMGGKMPEVEG